VPDRARDPFPLIRHHVLLHKATRLDEVDATLAASLTADAIAGVVDSIPDAWLSDDASQLEVARYRAAYRRYLLDRLTSPRWFVEEAVRAR
jgi:hypothetical protein